jgi:photosystem II stability/assembly factor-like uncharacterized protein
MRNITLIVAVVSLITLSAISIAGWNPITPIAYESAINTVDYFDTTSTVVAVGDMGIARRSTDAGATWDSAVIAPQNWNDVACSEGLFAISVGNAGQVSLTTDAGASWSPLTQFTSSNITSAESFNDSVFAAGCHNGEIWITQNRGASWTQATTPGTDHVYAVEYVTSSLMWASAGNSAWKSTDGGATWNTIRNFHVDNLTDVVFLDDQIGFVSGIYGDIYRTRDGGATWDSTGSFVVQQPMAIIAEDSATVQAIDKRGYFLKSAGSFHTWGYPSIGGTYADLTYLQNDNVYVAVGGDGPSAGAGGCGAVIARSTNQGVDWSYALFQQEFHILSVFFLNENEGWAGGGVDFQYGTAAPEVVVHTTDGGDIWETILLQAGGAGITDVFFVDSDTGWALAKQHIWRTYNGGSTWDQFNLSLGNDLSFINSQEGWYCGLSGYIRHTTNGGETWAIQSAPSTADYLYSIEFVDNQNGWCTGYNWQDHSAIILHTPNGGTNWYYQFHEVNATGFRTMRSIDMWNADQGIGVTNYGTILETTAGDTDWIETYAPDSASLNCVSYQDEFTAWASGDDGVIIFKTTGSPWQVDTVLTDTRILDIYAFDDDHRWATTDDGRILVFTPGQSIRGNGDSEVPHDFTLHQNYPNPFNPATQIQFHLPRASRVNLTIYNILGQQVAILLDKPLTAGEHTMTFDGSNLPSGIYFYRLTSDQFRDTRKMVLCK